jgi:hypothetical protein
MGGDFGFVTFSIQCAARHMDISAFVPLQDLGFGRRAARHVCGRETVPVAVADRTLPLLPVRGPHRSSRRCGEVEAAYYGAPPGWIGRWIKVQWDGLWVRLLDPKSGQLLREHIRQKRGWYRIKEEDRMRLPSQWPSLTPSCD